MSPPSSTPSTQCPNRSPYTELDTSQQEIRLLKFEPTSSPTSINCTFSTIPINKCPQFTALSYTWGEPNQCREISLNGLPFPVRENLWSFFLHFEAGWRNRAETQWLWIDAVCIDQSNIRERNHQVGMMKNIYSSADVVLSWLGPAADDSDVVMSFLSPLEFRDETTTIDTFSTHAAAITAFFQRPYWQRLWVVQEVVLARKHVVMCGHTRIEGNGMYFRTEVKRYITQGIEAQKPLLKSKYPALAIIVHRKRFKKERRWSPQNQELSSVIQKKGDFECVDARDKVYGLLALVEESRVVPVDYSKSTRAVFFDTLGKVLDTEWFGLNCSTGVRMLQNMFLPFARRLRTILKLDDGTLGDGFLYQFFKDAAACWPQPLEYDTWIESSELATEEEVFSELNTLHAWHWQDGIPWSDSE